ncbi:MAG: hypothetical protein R2940_02155 [Syntrophotaleaceae bacterium]
MPLIIGVWLFLLHAGMASAAENGHGGGDLLKDFIARFVNFALLAGLLWFFLRKPIKNALGERREKLAAALEEARRAREEAEARAALLAAQLEAGSREIEQLRRQLADETAKERALLTQQAEQAAESILREARNQADQQLERARRELQAEAAALAIELAEKQLATGLTAADQKRLVDESLKQVGGGQ